MEEQCGGSLGDFVGLDFGSYMDSYALYCHLLRCAKPLCYGSAHCSNLCLCVSRLHITVSKLLIEDPSCYFDAFGKFLIFLNQVLCFVILWSWSFLGCNHFGSYLFFQLFYLQPCSAKVAVPCPPAFTPGKFCLVILIFHHILWGSRFCLPPMFIFWYLSMIYSCDLWLYFPLFLSKPVHSQVVFRFVSALCMPSPTARSTLLMLVFPSLVLFLNMRNSAGCVMTRLFAGE